MAVHQLARPAPPTFADRLHDLADEHDAYPARVDRTTHPHDQMFNYEQRRGVPDAYFQIGHGAMRVLSAALTLAGKRDVRTILDLPCGHGRVMRMLRARWPEARIVGCDLLRSGVEFCAETFDAVPVISDPDPAQIPIREHFDLIWSGSLLTHLDAPLWQPFLRFYADRLAMGGLLVFTAAGRYPTLHLPGRETLRERYLADGFAYMDQTDPRCGWYSPRLEPGYGLACASPSWVLRQLEAFEGLRVLAFWERGWGDRQDVVVVERRAVGALPVSLS